MQAVSAIAVPPPYVAGMQATSPQQQQQLIYPPPALMQHQLPLQQVQVQAQAAPMPAVPQQDGYGAAVTAGSLHSMSPAQSHSAPSMSGQKRDSSGAPVHGGRDPTDGAFVKLFVGSVPRTITEDEVRPMFAEHGNVIEVAIIKDKRTGNQQGCCFVKYSTVEEADRAIRALHNQKTLPGGVAPVQVRYADGERERLGAVEHKLFVGSLNKQASEKEIEELFLPYGRVDDVYIMRDEQKQSRGCAFIKYSQRDHAQAAINALNGVHIMQGCDQPLAVRFADPKRPKGGDARVGGPGVGGPGFSPRQGSLVQQGPGGPRFVSMHAQMGHPAGRVPSMGWRPQAGLGLGPLQVPSPYGAATVARAGPVTGVPQMQGGMMVSELMNGHLQNSISVSGQVAAPVMLPLSPQQVSQGYYQQATQQRPQQQYVLQPPQQQQQQIQPLQLQPYVQMPLQQQSQAYMQQQVPPRPIMQVQPGQQQQQSQQPQVLMQLQLPPTQQQRQQQQQLPEQVAPQPVGQLQALQPVQQQTQQQPQSVQQLQPQQVYYQSSLPQSQQLQQPAYYLPVLQPQSLGSVAAPQPPAPQLTCDWSEHTSAEGYKYYYNSSSGESKWEKPEELKAFEQQQQQTQAPVPAAISDSGQQQFSSSASVQQTLPGMTYMQLQSVTSGPAEQPRQQGPPGANLFVFRIPDDFTDESMKETFAPFGNVINARVGVERESGRNRGFGFVSFDSADSADTAIQRLNNVAVGGRRLKVERKRGEENGIHGYQQQQF
ncbi:flowering time control protein FCA isoform X4 [Physcomitrium patens]|uniref:flowering time control protein FCA isoform X4 n=1 Tax=Physcomitrium patens TaxID=3218 RepID=UPI003CCE4464